MIENSLFRLFRWSSNFNPKYEYPITAAWVRPTYPRAYSSYVCMEVDISQPLPLKVWIGTGKDEGFYQKMVFEGKLAFCHQFNPSIQPSDRSQLVAIRSVPISG
ncbi:hypothetical protein Tco_1337101 [Tanacetum coccineum]